MAMKNEDVIADAATDTNPEDVHAGCRAETRELRDALLRGAAELENFKKRQQRERSDAIAFANEELARAILPAVDNLRRAVTAAERGEALHGAGARHGLVDGVKMTEKQLEDALARFGVQSISSVGEAFDPTRHEVVGVREDADVPAGVVLDELDRGYFLHHRLLRPARVVVSTGPPARERGDNEADEPASIDAKTA